MEIKERAEKHEWSRKKKLKFTKGTKCLHVFTRSSLYIADSRCCCCLYMAGSRQAGGERYIGENGITKKRLLIKMLMHDSCRRCWLNAQFRVCVCVCFSRLFVKESSRRKEQAAKFKFQKGFFWFLNIFLVAAAAAAAAAYELPSVH
jgi:hypothetical protein